MKAFFVIIVVLGAGFLVFVYSGIYNVAATEPHTRIVAWVLSTVMEQSVKERAADVKAPARHAGGNRQGFTEFHVMCEQCHGGPGVEPSAIGKGLNPKPPDLKERAGEWSEAELFWIVKHGIKMSGMPGFGPTHRDEEIWPVVAFLKELRKKTAEEYRKLTEQDRKPSGH